MLRVVGRMANGYHELQTVFQFFDLCDQLNFLVRADGQIRRVTDLADVPEQSDLTVMAATRLQQATGCQKGVDIYIDKQLPMGGGLGGGSSDAATTLVALNHLWETGLGLGDLSSLGLAIGADVPVFIKGQAAWAEGVGENLTEIDLPEPWYLVLNPGCHVSTAAVFQSSELTRNSPRITIRDFLAGNRSNDCQPVTVSKYPEVAQALDWLGRYADAHMTGTGACVYAAFDDENEARELLNKVPDEYDAFVTRALNRSPLLDRLEEG